MECIENEVFRRDTVRLDGKKFLHCAFEECVLHYGGAPCEWEHTRFVNCRIVLDDKAHNTVEVLRGLGFLLRDPESSDPELDDPSIR